jgi:NAD-dependent dihydropyrimidine dehydrogenase PreA subunit
VKEELLMHEIIIRLEDCSGCKRCVDTCFADVIRWDKETKCPQVLYLEECAVCNWCEIVCPNDCVKVIPVYPVVYPEYYPLDIYPLANNALTL